MLLLTTGKFGELLRISFFYIERNRFFTRKVKQVKCIFVYGRFNDSINQQTNIDLTFFKFCNKYGNEKTNLNMKPKDFQNREITRLGDSLRSPKGSDSLVTIYFQNSLFLLQEISDVPPGISQRNSCVIYSAVLEGKFHMYQLIKLQILTYDTSPRIYNLKVSVMSLFTNDRYEVKKLL